MRDYFNWTCPHCQRHVTISETITEDRITLKHENADGRRTLVVNFIVCPNPECRKFTLEMTLFKSVHRFQDGKEILQEPIKAWKLIPPSEAKTYPGYIPKAVVEDYTEACLIRDLSPKASATLARRCLQGIIRDFWEVKPGRLVDEIDSIKEKTDGLTWQAIDAVRKIGNIGAHMEKDIDLIVDVEPNEAALLIELIETLIADWYIGREERKARLQSIVSISEAKEDAKKARES